MTKINYIVETLKIAQVAENSLLHEIEKLLVGREQFTDTNKEINEKLYSGDVFENILQEKLDGEITLSDKALKQLRQLVIQLTECEYIMISK